jgi:NodT family efflux transporter outer membrane factor (OMF) lipoprotein
MPRPIGLGLSRAAITPVPALLALLMVSGCDLAPRYQVPATPAAPARYQNQGPWTPAAPADMAPRGAWWRVFGDPDLDALEDRIDRGSTELAEYVARYDQAAASTHIARADLFPTLTAQGNGEHGRSLLYGRESDDTGSAGLTYEVDLWGRVRNEIRAARSDEQASKADLASVRLSLEAELAEDYANLRGEDAVIVLLGQTDAAYQQALDLTQKRYVGGASSELDVDRARTQLLAAQSQLEQEAATRAAYQDAIAALIGENASSFSIPAGTMPADPPPIPLTAPSALLQRRPDIAAAERRVASANARIGQARAAFYPSLTLGSTGGYETIAGTLVKASGFIWAAGPATSMLTLFDAGRHSAEVRRARGEWAEAAASYRQTVLDAFQQVEDQLALVNRLAVAGRQENEAVAAATRTNALATVQYKDGAVDYLQVVTAQTAELDAQRSAIGIATRRLIAAVDLIRALGGGWSG